MGLVAEKRKMRNRFQSKSTFVINKSCHRSLENVTNSSYTIQVLQFPECLWMAWKTFFANCWLYYFHTKMLVGQFIRFPFPSPFPCCPQRPAHPQLINNSWGVSPSHSDRINNNFILSGSPQKRRRRSSWTDPHKGWRQYWIKTHLRATRLERQQDANRW